MAVGTAYTNFVDFNWDPRKAAANFKKHEIDFHEAATVLEDALSTTFPYTDHSSLVESRFLTIEMMRIITARHATRHERRFYEEG